MTRDEHIAWLDNPDNSHKCEECPENMGYKNYDPDYKLPCGQQHCWVDVTCWRDEE